MREHKDIKYNCHEYGNGLTYMTVGINMGYASRYYMVEGKEPFVNNLAFANLWADCIRQSSENEIDVGRTVTSITAKGHVDSLGEDIAGLIKNVFRREYGEDEFACVKEKAIEDFKRAYADGEYRAWLKSCEISELGKGFLMKELITGLEGMDYEGFTECARMLVVPSNAVMYVNGNLRDLTDEEFSLIDRELSPPGRRISLAARDIDPCLRSDAHVLALSAKPQNVDTVCFSFGKDVGMEDRMIYLAIESEKLPFENKRTHLDGFDASVTLNEEEPEKLKNFFRQPMDADHFGEVRNKLLTRYGQWLSGEPGIFGAFSVRLILNNILPEDYLWVLGALDHEAYAGVAKRIRPMVTEAQIVMRR